MPTGDKPSRDDAEDRDLLSVGRGRLLLKASLSNSRGAKRWSRPGQSPNPTFLKSMAKLSPTPRSASLDWPKMKPGSAVT